MIINLFGKEPYLVFSRRRELEDAFRIKNPEGSLFVYDLEDNGIDEFAENLFSGSGMFAEKKMIVLKNIFSLSAASQERVVELLENSKIKKSEGAILIVSEERGKASAGKLAEYLKAHSKKSEEFRKMDAKKLTGWIISEFEKSGEGKISISLEAVTLLAEICAEDLWKIKREIEKLTSFKSSGAIGIEEISKLCSGEKFSGIFEFIDAVGLGDKSRSMRLKVKMLRQGENEFMLFSMIMGQLRNLIKVQYCLGKGLRREKEISDRLGLHPFVVKKTLFQLKNFSRGKLKKMFDLGAQIDQGAKSGKYTIGEALDYFIAKI